MSSCEGSDFAVARAATSTQCSTEVAPQSTQQGHLLTHTPHKIIIRTGTNSGDANGAAFHSVPVSPEKKPCGNWSNTDVLDLTSPPPRPPKLSESGNGRRHHGGRHDADDGGVDHSHEQLLHLERAMEDTITSRRIIAFDSEDATTSMTTTTETASRTPAHETHATRGPFSSMEASDSISHAFFSTTQLLNATTMPQARLEASRDSGSAFSPSAHRPTPFTTSTSTTTDHDGQRGKHQYHDPAIHVASAATAAPTTPRGAHGFYESKSVAARNPSSGCANDDPENFTTGTAVMPAAQSLLFQEGFNEERNHNEGECAESDDEDEDGLFQETVLFMNNTLHSLGSTRRTPSKPTQQPQTPQKRDGSSPVHYTPDSLDATPAKPARPIACENNNSCVAGGNERHRHSSDIDECRPDCEEVRSCRHGDYGSTVYSPEMNIPTMATSTQAYMTSPASPATTCSAHAPAAAVSTSPFPGPELSRSAFPQLPTTTTTNKENSNNFCRTQRDNSEYVFIDNHDGTAYLADASLQLDGSYTLGQTILLARSSAASPTCSVCPGGQHNNTDGKSCRAVSPIVVPQTADQLPQQREQYAHRPVRGTTPPEAATSMSAAGTSESPTAIFFNEPSGSPIAPSVARVVIRRSQAPARDASGDDDAAATFSSLLPSSFNDFAFSQTLLVPMEDTLRSSSFAEACSPCAVDSRRGKPLPLRVQSVASSVRGSSYRSTAPARCDSAASPFVVVPTSPAASFAVYRSSTLRSHTPSTASSVSCASPVPHAPSVGQQLASQEARVARDTRPSRPDQDIIYLVPPGAAIPTMTPADITEQGWIPVQVVDVLPTPNHNNNRNGGGGVYGNPYIVSDGRMTSPLPKDPEARAHLQMNTNAHSSTHDDDRVHGDDAEDKSDEGGAREQSLSRLSHGRPEMLRNASLSLASTFSASTLDCINRRLSYSVSGWASARQRFGHSMSMGDRSSVSGIVLPPATPLTLSAGTTAQGSLPASTAQQHNWCTGQQPTSLQECKDRPRNCSLQPSSGHDNETWAMVRGDDNGNSNASPVPLPPGTPETPQREQSPSRCATMSAQVITQERKEEATQTANTANTTAAAAESQVASSLITSMSYQRPSTMTMSDEYTGDCSMSLPLTSSASQSTGLNGGHNNLYNNNRNMNAESFSMYPHPVQHQVLRAPHPRRVSGATALSQGASSLSFQTFGEPSEQPSSGMSHNISTGNSNNVSNSNMSVAASTSFRATYCNNRASLGSVRAASLNPGSSGGPATSVSNAGLPLSRGNLGATAGTRGGNGNGGGAVITAAAAGTGAAQAHSAIHLSQQKRNYPQQYAAAAERRRAGLTGGGYHHPSTATIHPTSGSLSTDSLAAHSGIASRNFPHHHPYLSTRQQNTRRGGAVAAAAPGGRGNPRRLNGACLVPDTSVFLPWAPLTITPEGSLNLARTDKDGAEGAPMNLIPFSSLETSTVTTTTTTQTTTTPSGADGLSVQEMAQQFADNLAKKDSAELFPETLRTLSTAVAVMSRAANEGNDEALLNDDRTVSKDAFVSSFLLHAASQAATSVGGGSLNTASIMTTTTTTTLSATGKSLAVSRASMTSGGLHTQDHSQYLNFQTMTTMEATLNQFQGSVSAVSVQEPEPRAPVPPATTTTTTTNSQLRDVQAGGDKENGSAVRSSAGRKSESVGTARAAGLHEGPPANAVRYSGKACSPLHTAPTTDSHTRAKNVA